MTKPLDIAVMLLRYNTCRLVLIAHNIVVAVERRIARFDTYTDFRSVRGGHTKGFCSRLHKLPAANDSPFRHLAVRIPCSSKLPCDFEQLFDKGVFRRRRHERHVVQRASVGVDLQTLNNLHVIPVGFLGVDDRTRHINHTVAVNRWNADIKAVVVTKIAVLALARHNHAAAVHKIVKLAVRYISRIATEMHSLYLAEVNTTFLCRCSVSIKSSVKPLHILGDKYLTATDNLIPEVESIACAVTLVAVVVSMGILHFACSVKQLAAQASFPSVVDVVAVVVHAWAVHRVKLVAVAYIDLAVLVFPWRVL